VIICSRRSVRFVVEARPRAARAPPRTWGDNDLDRVATKTALREDQLVEAAGREVTCSARDSRGASDQHTASGRPEPASRPPTRRGILSHGRPLSDRSKRTVSRARLVTLGASGTNARELAARVWPRRRGARGPVARAQSRWSAAKNDGRHLADAEGKSARGAEGRSKYDVRFFDGPQR